MPKIQTPHLRIMLNMNEYISWFVCVSACMCVFMSLRICVYICVSYWLLERKPKNIPTLSTICGVCRNDGNPFSRANIRARTPLHTRMQTNIKDNTQWNLRLLRVARFNDMIISKWKGSFKAILKYPLSHC